MAARKKYNKGGRRKVPRLTRKKLNEEIGDLPTTIGEGLGVLDQLSMVMVSVLQNMAHHQGTAAQAKSIESMANAYNALPDTAPATKLAIKEQLERLVEEMKPKVVKVDDPNASLKINVEAFTTDEKGVTTAPPAEPKKRRGRKAAAPPSGSEAPELE
jgi:hypothetical protein